MLDEEGFDNVLQRHARHGEATRAAVRAWGLDIVAEDPAEYSSSLTAVYTPEGHNADRLRQIILENSTCRSEPASASSPERVFRIGHLGAFNDLMLAGTLSGVEMGLRWRAFRTSSGGVMAALESLTATAQADRAKTLRW